MDWDDLRYVRAIAAAGSLVEAGRALGVSHPTVFRRLNRIEQHLGVRLFERRRDGYAPTPAGEEMVAAAGVLADTIDGLERRLAGRDLRPAGTVRVTTTDTLLLGALTPIFADFRQAHPEIRLEVVVSNEMIDLSKRFADVAVRPTTRPPERLVGRRVADIAVAVYGARDRQDMAEPVAVADQDWIGPDESLSALPLVRWMAARGVEANVVYRVNSLLALRDAAAAGVGLAALPCFLADREPRLMRLGEPIAELQGQLWLLTHPDLRRVARIRAFLDFVAERLSAQRASFAGQPDHDF